MKIINLDENCMTIFLNKYFFKSEEIDIKKDLEGYFRNLFLNLQKYYDINISGYYNIDVYIDDNYGLVINIKKEEVEYFDYFDNQIDMRIVLKNNKFLYGVEDIYVKDIIKDKIDIYFYKNKYYIDFIYDVNINLISLIEFCDIVYDDEVEKIRCSTKININNTSKII